MNPVYFRKTSAFGDLPSCGKDELFDLDLGCIKLTKINKTDYEKFADKLDVKPETLTIGIASLGIVLLLLLVKK